MLDPEVKLGTQFRARRESVTDRLVLRLHRGPTNRGSSGMDLHGLQRQVFAHRMASVSFITFAAVLLILDQLGVARDEVPIVGLRTSVPFCVYLSIFNLVRSWQFDGQVRRLAKSGSMARHPGLGFAEHTSQSKPQRRGPAEGNGNGEP
jgi:hypothetical protein